MAKPLPITLHCDNKRDPGGPVVRTSPSNVGGAGSMPGQEAKIPTCLVAPKPKKNIKQKQCCHKFNKDLKNGSHQKKFILNMKRESE